MGGGVSGGVSTERGIATVRIGGSVVNTTPETWELTTAATPHAAQPVIAAQPTGE